MRLSTALPYHRSPRRQRDLRGMTLVELLVASGLGTIILVAVLTLSLFSARSFAALTNYVDLDNFSRNTLDFMTREIRQADCLVAGGEHFLEFQHTDPYSGNHFNVRYAYSPETRELVRSQGSHRSVLLEECDFLRFRMFQRNPVGGTYDQYPTATPETCKLVQMHWICSREIMQKAVNTESVQSAKVVIRKQ